MKIDNLQVPKGYTKAKTSSTTESKEDFSKVLSEEINTSKVNNVKEEEKTNKVVNSSMEDIEVDEGTDESINTLLVFMNIPLFEENPVDIATLGGEQLVELNEDSSICLNLLNVDNMDVQTSFTGSSVSEGFVLENLIGSEILVDNEMPENNGIISFDDKTLQDGTNLDINIGNGLVDVVKQKSGDKALVIDNEFSSVNEVKSINLEELTKIEDFDLNKLIDDEVLDIKKEEPIEESKWLNHNMETSQKVNIANNIEQQPKAISNENIQNINDSIVQLMETTTEGNTNVMKVQLYPEELGAVNITLKMEDGKLIAKILVDDDYVKQLFVGKIEQLNNSLIKQNVNMKDIFVELNSNSNPNGESGQNNSSFANQNKGFKFAKEPMGGISSEQIELDLGELSILA